MPKNKSSPQQSAKSLSEPSENPKPVSKARQVWFRLIALLVIPLFGLALIEGVLRLANFGYPTSFFLKRKIGGETFLTENDKFAWRFFPPALARSPSPMRISPAKRAGAIRIIVFGESAALGDPKPAFSMGRHLEVLLRERYPSGQFEVITAAMTAINSHGLLQIARDCTALGADYWVIYMGNNEMMGPFGANPISGPAAPSVKKVRTALALQSTRIGQALAAGWRKIRKADSEQSWEGMKMFSEHQVPPNAPAKAVVYANFQENLRDIVRLAIKSGARPILCTVASNLKDSSPFASAHGTTVTTAQAKQCEDLLRLGDESGKTNAWDEAGKSFAQALEIDASFAEAQFGAANSALHLGDLNAATRGFEKARDLDALPFRTDARLNELIRNISAEFAGIGAQLVDLETAIGQQTAEGPPGGETFYDHVHLTFPANYRVARLLAAKIEEFLPGGLTQTRAVTWAPATVCEQRLGLTDWNRRAAVESMLQRLNEEPFTLQSSHPDQMAALSREVLELRSRTTSAAAAEARSLYETALAARRNDFRLHENYAEFLEMTGQVIPAGNEWREVAELIPYHQTAYFQMGRLLSKTKQFEPAKQNLETALRIRPDFAEARMELGLVYYLQGHAGEALAQYDQAKKLRPHDSRLLVLRADALGALNRRDEAMDALREAIRLRPNYWEARYLLGVELAEKGRIGEAFTEFKEVTRLRPDYAAAHFNLGVALAKAGQLGAALEEFRETLRIDPNHKLATEYLKNLEASLQKTPAAPK